MKGNVDIVKGRIEEAAGVMLDSEKLREKGQTDQAVGHVKLHAERSVSHAKEYAKKIVAKAKNIAQQAIDKAKKIAN